MRIFIVLAVAAGIVAIALGMVKTVFIAGPGALATSVTMSPHEIHLNYKNMKELPVHEGKNAF
jgi:hypothetical protein